jgi:AcrR family transcriptional regulator
MLSVQRTRIGGVDPETLWLQPVGSRLGRPPAHSRAEVTAAAIAVADAEGLSAVTMRRVATAIGASVMSLYSYVPDKETLLELMIDQVSGEHALTAGADWRDGLRRFAHEQRALMRRHGWLTSVLADRQTLGPNMLAALEHLLDVLAPVDADPRAKLEAIALLNGFVAGHVTYELAQQRAGRSTGEALAAQLRYLRAAVATGRYPRLGAALNAGRTRGPDPAATFDRMLDQLISGLLPGS